MWSSARLRQLSCSFSIESRLGSRGWPRASSAIFSAQETRRDGSSNPAKNRKDYAQEQGREKHENDESFRRLKSLHCLAAVDIRTLRLDLGDELYQTVPHLAFGVKSPDLNDHEQHDENESSKARACTQTEPTSWSQVAFRG